MFKRNENGRLQFDRLEFECMISDILCEIEEKNESDLKWMVKCLIDSLQLVAWEHATEDMEIDEWEDLFYPID